ncbi:MAG: SRPBCC domain-containing protein [Gemmatimonadales bacterium]
MNEPLVKTIEVPGTREQAFAVFLDMGTWWPVNRFATAVMRGAAVAELRVDPREGGRIVEVGSDGRETLWGRIVVLDSPQYLKLDFHVPHPSEANPGFTTVEIRFTALGPELTRVELTQSGWEGLGDVAAMAQQGYPGAWVMIFEGRYREACAAA